MSRGGEGLLALVQRVGDGLPGFDDARADHWCVLLTRHLQGPAFHQALDDFADLGRLRVMWGVLAGLVQRGTLRPDRQVLERVRDAGLDFGDLDLALAAQQLDAQWWGEDKNEWLALGDIHAYRGAFAESDAAFATALSLDPENGHARRRREALADRRYDAFTNQGGFGTPQHRKAVRAAQRRDGARARPELARQAVAVDPRGLVDALAPELAPGRPSPPHVHDGLHLRRLGARHERSRWGVLPALRGVEAIRGFYVSASPVGEVRVSLGGHRIGRCVPKPFPVAGDDGRSKYVFNEWVDLAPFPAGRYRIELTFDVAGAEAVSHREEVLVHAPWPDADHADSDALVAAAGADEPSLTQAVNARPSRVREARRTLFSSPPRSILVLRTDQLGDMVCSIPALRRLRAIFPNARITGLVSPVNEGLARTLPVFDDLIVADFATSPAEGRRVMSIDAQTELAGRLAVRSFDLAIDLADNSPSRLLLPLSGAPYLAGMRGRDYPFLDLGFEAAARDQVNGSENVPAGNKALALIEWLAIAMGSYGETVRRDDLSPALLDRFGLHPDRYAVLHTGARLAFSRWPYYGELAAILLARTNLNVVLLADDAAFGSTLDGEMKAHPRLRLIDQRLAFDELDALLSFGAVFVGNDSGPKHLASLRGCEVVSIHCARNNWNEWGQENTGLILSRGVPCAGCQLSDAPEECGKDFVCLTGILAEEVFSAVASRLR